VDKVTGNYSADGAPALKQAGCVPPLQHLIWRIEGELRFGKKPPKQVKKV